MHTPTHTTILLGALALSLCAPTFAQEAPTPAPELKQLQPLIGSWQGTGTAVFDPSAGPVKWTSHSTYRWALKDFVVEEDTVVEFEGMPQPMVLRQYRGWDPEQKRFFGIMISNDGVAKRGDFLIAPDGTMVLMLDQNQQGMSYVERMSSKIEGDKMTFWIDMMAALGPAQELVRGTLERTDKEYVIAKDATAFMAGPGEQMHKLARMTGVYDIQAKVAMSPEMVMDVKATDHVTTMFSGQVLHVATKGFAEGDPNPYEAHGFFCWDAANECYSSVFVSNMGEVGQMASRFSADGKSLVSTSAAPVMGELSVQRHVMHLDDQGRPTKGTGEFITGTGEPFEAFNGTYKRKS